MERSRQTFERKSQEWKALRDLLTPKHRLKKLLESLETQEAGGDPPSSQMTTLESLVEAEGVAEGMASNTQLQEQIPPQNKILDLATVMEEISDSNLSDLEDVTSTFLPPPHPPKDLHEDSKRRESPRFVETLRKKSARKDSHAKDCPCCSKVLTHSENELYFLSYF